MQKEVPKVTALLQGRLYACRETLRQSGLYLSTKSSPFPPTTPTPVLANLSAASLINGIKGWKLATPSPMPTVPVACNSGSHDPMVLYGALGKCLAFIKALPSPTPTPSSTPVTFRSPANALPDHKVIYTMALAADAPSAAQLAVRTAGYLNRIDVVPIPTPTPSNAPPQHRAFDPISGTEMSYIVSAQPGWALTQYQQQCANDPSTAGAVVILAPGTQTAVTNYLFWATSWTKVTLQAMVLDCEPISTTYLGNVAYITYVSNVHEGLGPRTSIPLATYLAVLSAITALHPSTTTGTTTNYSAATPSPPVVGKEYPSGYQQSTSTTTNPNGALLIAASGFLGGLSTVNIGEQGSNDVQLAKAADRILPSLVGEMATACQAQSRNVPTQPDYWFCYWFGWAAAPNR
jgi:hypothetical protein